MDDSDSAAVGHDGLPGHFCRRSGIQLKLDVHARRAEIVSLFRRYDLGQLTVAELRDSLRGVNVHLTHEFHLATRKPPLTLAKLLHALTIPDCDRFDLKLASTDAVAGPQPVSCDHSRQYAIFGERWDSENSKLRANTTPFSKDAMRKLFKDLHFGLTTAESVASTLTSLGIEVNARRQRLLLNCERGSENGFRELVVEFQEPSLMRDELPKECHSEGARRAVQDARSRASSPRRAPSSKPARAPHRSEICTPYLTVWDQGASPGLSDWERRNQELAQIKQVHLERTTRSHFVQNGSMVPAIMEPAPIPLQVRVVPDDPQLAAMRIAVDQPDYFGPATHRSSSRAPPLPEVRSKALAGRPELRYPWGSDSDVVPPGSRALRPPSMEARRFQTLALKCCQEMANLDQLVRGQR